VLLLDRGREPRRLDLLGLDAGVAERFLVGLDDEVLGVGVPTLAEARAAHAENGDLVANAAGHDQVSDFACVCAPAGAAFQK
jgi:hypothetical protein